MLYMALELRVRLREGGLLELQYENLSERWVEQCAALELAAFPHADPADLLNAEDLAAYVGIFPEGFFVCHDGDRVVGQAGGIFVDFDFENPQHTIAEITGENQCGNHDPDGDWYYGTDIVVDSTYRRRGIGKRLYQLRKDLVMEKNRRGILAGGYIHGYADHKHDMSAAEYVKKVAAGELYDPTLSFQLENGFEARGVLANYIDDPDIDGWAALIVWINPRYA